MKRRKNYQLLTGKKLLAPYAKNVCQACLDFVGSNTFSATATNNEITTENDDNLNNIQQGTMEIEETNMINDIDSELLTTVEKLKNLLTNVKYEEISLDVRNGLKDIAGNLGRVINSDLYSDGQNVSKEYKDIKGLTTIEPKLWLEKRNPILVEFLIACTDTKLNSSSKIKKNHALVHAVEQIMYARNLNLITPFAFQRNLIVYSVTNSKDVARLTGSWESSGSYSTLSQIVTSPSPPIQCPIGDVHNTIDNNQKVGRTSGRIKEGSKVPTSICTTMCHIVPQPSTSFQHIEHLMPKYWLDMTQMEKTLEEVENLEKIALNEFRNYRGNYIQEIISEVVNEQSQVESRFIFDYIDTAVANKGNVYTCSKCGETYQKSQTCCPSCKNNPDNHDQGYDPYHRTESKHSSEKPHVHIGEPCMVNPNSLETVKKVIEHVLEVTGVKDTEHPRKWTIMHSDGVPYVYASDLQDNFFACSVCKLEVSKGELTIDQWNNYLAEHKQICSGTFELLFGDIMFIPGPGHIELNSARLLLKFLWQPFMSYFVKQLGFRTPKAQQVVLNGVDHHRSKQLLSCSLEAISKELVVPYVRHCIQMKEEPCNYGYQLWVENVVTDPTYMFLYHVTFTYLLSFHLYNEATRKNHSLRMMASRIQLSKLFYSFNHRKYQKLLLRDLCQRVQMPDTLLEHINSHESFSTSGEPNRGEGADFVHENSNRVTKSFLPPGMPTADVWKRVCRKATDLTKLKENALGNLKKSQKRYKKHDNEVTMMRREIRSLEYITMSPENFSQIKSIDGNPLDCEICDFRYNADENYKNYKNELKETQKFGCNILNPIFITPDERKEFNKIETKTKSKIIEEIKKVLSKMPSEETVKDIEQDLKKGEKLKKPELIDIFYDTERRLEQQLAEVEVEETDSEVLLEETDD